MLGLEPGSHNFCPRAERLPVDHRRHLKKLAKLQAIGKPNLRTSHAEIPELSFQDP
jgi:hypothetical protein